MNQDRKKELWLLVKEIGEIINETSKTINCLVVRRVDSPNSKSTSTSCKTSSPLSPATSTAQPPAQCHQGQTRELQGRQHQATQHAKEVPRQERKEATR